MKKTLIAVVIGLILCWVSLPLIHASANLDFFNEDNPNAFTYKQYLLQIVKEMKTANIHLQNIEDNTKAVKDKLHA